MQSPKWYDDRINGKKLCYFLKIAFVGFFFHGAKYMASYKQTFFSQASSQQQN